ncbi:restriction endonuclease [Rhizobium laguerreae]|uniref:restriction endonuclease n=1 Tax=Rhizobium laguerreae TaxID=1076926 RepID=UPI001C8FD380|nr:restriction endonuclease [Rhizobium laguerreae]MBY3168702.1 hypothetical protein [Rhizobium laguerreae]
MIASRNLELGKTALDYHILHGGLNAKITSRMPDSWEELEETVAAILRECGMDSARTVNLKLPRGSVDIDVVAKEVNDGIQNLIICECKNWKTKIPREIVHAFRTVMSEIGANRGYIISRLGFQVGAHEAAEATNISLVTFEEFQERYFAKWYKARLWAIERSIGNFNVYYEPLGQPGYNQLETSEERVRLKPLCLRGGTPYVFLTVERSRWRPAPTRPTNRNRQNRPFDKQETVVKGYYDSDRSLVEKIKFAVLGDRYDGDFKTVECSIMDIADDIAYSTYDLEDVFKSGFHNPLDLFAFPDSIYESVAKTINKRLAKQYPETERTVTVKDVQEILFDVFSDMFSFGTEQLMILKNRKTSNEYKKMYFSVEAQKRASVYAEDGYSRTAFTSNLVQVFLQGVEVIPHAKYPQLHKVRLDLKTFVTVEVLKNITYESVIRAPALQVVEYRGKDIVKKIFAAISEKDGERLMPPDFREVYKKGDELNRRRTICDFIAGMTDRYAAEFYSRLFGANGMTMHKPL